MDNKLPLKKEDTFKVFYSNEKKIVNKITKSEAENKKSKLKKLIEYNKKLFKEFNLEYKDTALYVKES